MRFTINQAETETRTQISAHIIHLFAFLIFSSSPPEMRYMIPAIIRAMTAITEVYFIISLITFAIIATACEEFLLILVGLEIPEASQPGSHSQLIVGAFAKSGVSTQKKRSIQKKQRKSKNIFFIKN
jgi:hypothetical protein